MFARTLQLQSFGPTETSLHLKTVELPEPGKGQILLRMEASPIHPADLLLIKGKYGLLPELPAVVGNEGVGRIVRCGEGVHSLQAGDLVLPGTSGMWTEARLAEADDCILLPRELDIFQAAQITVAPLTAYWMLTSILSLPTGSWVVQNAANSAVGRCVIQIARCLRLKTLNVVRRADLREELLELGADTVIIEEDLEATIKNFYESALPRLALNAVGGASGLALANTLAPGGIHLTYGAISRQPLTIPETLLIYKNIVFKGFWRTSHWNSFTVDERQAVIHQLVQWVENGSLHLPVEKTYPIQDFQLAISHAQQEKRSGKILLKFPHDITDIPRPTNTFF